jgi:hypothetical protein
MKTRFALLVFFLLIAFSAESQQAQSETEQNGSWDFFLIPVLETAFSGSVLWYPGRPDDIPPDAFYLLNREKPPAVIELNCGEYNFTVRRDEKGRLVEFPFFTANDYALVTAEYSDIGALEKMGVTVKKYAAQDGGEGAEDQTWNIDFPAGFLPYSELSPGGSFPPLKVTFGEDIFYLFIFESPAFLTETWYNSGGEMLAFCKASVNTRNGAWRIRSLQIHDAQGVRFEDRFFDAYGNISEIRFEDNVFTSLFFNFLNGYDMPVLWRSRDYQYGLTWDAAGFLRTVKAAGDTEDAEIEYRYEYELDFYGNWVKRLEAAYAVKFDLLAPQPSLSRGVWSRRIEYFENGNGD